MTSTSRSLLQRLQDRDDTHAWKRLLTVYEPWLRGWLSRTGLQQADRDDVLQEVLTVVSQKAGDFVHNGQPGAFRAWLRAILVNQVKHHLRAKRAREEAAGPAPLADWLEQMADPSSALSQEWEREHDRQLVRRVLTSIQHEFNGTTWQVFQMLVFEEVPPAEVAQRLEITTNAVYVAKARVMSRLREEVSGLVDE
jgi:RNA polymerase sigma-70 factor (ECF subfamily)